MAPSCSNGRRVVLFPLPYQGHINPMFHLAAALHARGFTITILHTEVHAPQPAKHPNYRFVAIPDNVPRELAASGDVRAFVMTLNANCEEPFRDYLARALRDDGGAEGRVSCVVTDVDWFMPQAVAKELGVPGLCLMTSSAARFRTYMAYPLLLQKGYLPAQESQLDVLVDELQPLRVRDLGCPGTSKLHPYADLLHHIVSSVKQSSGLILNTFDAIEGSEVEKLQKEASVPVFAIGPLHKFSPRIESSLLSQDRSCLEWLDTQAPSSVLYASFGSLATVGAHEFVETAWGLANSKHPFIWVVRPGLVRDLESNELPDGLVEKIHDIGRIICWAPQEDVLAHPAIGAFLTHNGWNSTMEAISEGIPMICSPCSGDQMGTTRYVCDIWKVGMEIENRPDRRKISEAIKKLMDKKEGKEIREMTRGLKNVAARCISEGGSSYTSLNNLVDFIMSF